MSLNPVASMDSRTTRCPECQTAFRVTEHQLLAAEGMVRCGTCMHVFNASQHWSNAGPAEEKGIRPPPGSALLRSEAVIDPVWAAERTPPPPEPIHHLPDPEDDFEFSDSFLALSSPKATPEADPFANQDSEEEASEEDWARQLLEAEERSSTPEPRREILQAISGVATGATDERPPGQGAATAPSRGGDEPASVQGAERWLQDLLGDAGGDEAPAPAPSTAPVPPSNLAEPTEVYVPEIFRQPASSAPAAATPAGPGSPEKGRPRGVPWTLAAVVTTTLLAIQHVWFNAATLAERPGYRSMLEPFCALTHCRLPQRQDIDRISNHNLVVFKHPTVEGALILDTILTNTADFEQPYPRLKIEFSDLQNQVVARRVFLPEQYLGGDVSPDSLMPTERPVHLSIELDNPGERALNYEIQLLPHKG